jgi:hypothetical protein
MALRFPFKSAVFLDESGKISTLGHAVVLYASTSTAGGGASAGVKS